MTAEREGLRAQRKALRGRLNDKRREMDQRLASMPAAQKGKVRRRLLWAVLLLLILLCLSWCRCTSRAPAPPQPGRPVVIKVAKALAPPAKRQAARANTTKPQRRAQYNAESPVEPPWVEAFRLQVAARSQRLAGCFVGVPRPGAVRWTAGLTAETGAVFDHHIQSVPPSEDLTADQQRCVVGVLSRPGYPRLATTYAGALPETVTLVFEF